MTIDTRYPYTYADDYVRGLAGYGEQGTKLSRCEASKIIMGIANAIGIDDKELYCKLADHYKANEDEITNKSVAEFMAERNALVTKNDAFNRNLLRIIDKYGLKDYD